MDRDNLITILKGMWIGGTMTVPGVSGGSMAMILGVYDRLISSVSSFFKNPGKSMSFLVRFVLGAGVGMVLFSRFISFLFTTRADVPLRFFFLGAVAGGVPMIYREAGIRKISLGAVAYPVIGILGVVILALLPTVLFAPDGSFGPGAVLIQLAGGVIIAVGLVLPGISVSQMLYMLGIYEGIIKNISTLNILPHDSPGRRRAGRHLPYNQGAGTADAAPSPANLPHHPGIYVRFPSRTVSGRASGH